MPDNVRKAIKERQRKKEEKQAEELIAQRKEALADSKKKHKYGGARAESDSDNKVSDEENNKPLDPLGPDRAWFHGKKKEDDDNKKVKSWIEGGKFTREDNPHPLLEESSFQILFPQWREEYLKKAWPVVTAILAEHFIACELDLVKGAMTVKTTRKTFDPFIIVKARDMIKLLSRGVDVTQAKRVLEDDIYCEIIKISGMCANKDRFVKRRNRLIGPDGSTLKAIELLTDCYILVQGKTVCTIGPIMGLKFVHDIVVDCMNNIHPIYHIKELMVKKELMKNPQLQDKDWSAFLPKFKKTVYKKKKKATKTEKKKKKEYSPFPPPRELSKVDIALETGEYFLTQQEKEAKKKAEIKQKQEAATKEKVNKRNAELVAPAEDKKKKNTSSNNNKKDSIAIKDLAEKVKENTQKLSESSKKRSITLSAEDFLDKRNTKKMRS